MNKGNSSQSKFVNWISIGILWFGIGYCFLNGIVGDIRVVFGIVLLTAATITTYINTETGVKFTFIIVVVGTLNLVKYFPLSLGVGYGDYSFGIEILLFIIGIIHYLTNRSIILGFISGLIHREKSEDEKQKDERSRINGYKNRFSKKNIDDLNLIANDESLVPEAIIAAKELIDKRKNQEEDA